jgi:type III restriction enzyme
VVVCEGVLYTLRATRAHFEALLPGLRVRSFAYDGARLHQLRAFACSAEPELMVLTLDAFNKASNRLRRPHDAFAGRAPLALLAAVRPLVVLDEPQRMESDKSRTALADLAPILVLRYSATHRRLHALVHRLTPRQAFG